MIAQTYCGEEMAPVSTDAGDTRWPVCGPEDGPCIHCIRDHVTRLKARIRELEAQAAAQAGGVVVPAEEMKALESVWFHATEVAAGIREMGPSRLSEPLEHALHRIDTIRAAKGGAT